MKSIIKSLLIVIIVGLILFMGIKSFYFEIAHFDNDIVAQQVDNSGEIDKLYLIKGNTIVLKKSFNDKFEFAVFNIKGSSATHYFGPFYNTGETLLSFKVYPNATAVWKSEMTLINKVGNLDKSTFDNIGETFNNLIVIKQSSVDLTNHTYNIVTPTEEDKKFIEVIRDKKL